MKTKQKRSKEYYKEQAKKLAARQTYDIVANPANISETILSHKLCITPDPNNLDFDFKPTVAELLACDGQPNQEFWQYWTITWAPGAMKLFNPKKDILDSGVRVTKNSAGKWTLVVNGVEAIGSALKEACVA